MNENYTTQILGSNSGAENCEAIFPQMDYLGKEIRKLGKRKKGKGKKGKGKKGKGNKKLKKQIKAIEEQQQLTQQLLAFALWQCQAQASISVVEPPKKKKKRNKTPKWFEQVLTQSLPQVITTGFDRLMPPPQSQPVLALTDGCDHK